MIERENECLPQSWGRRRHRGPNSFRFTYNGGFRCEGRRRGRYPDRTSQTEHQFDLVLASPRNGGPALRILYRINHAADITGPFVTECFDNRLLERTLL